MGSPIIYWFYFTLPRLEILNCWPYFPVITPAGNDSPVRTSILFDERVWNGRTTTTNLFRTSLPLLQNQIHES